jgi:hypothetical protein
LTFFVVGVSLFSDVVVDFATGFLLVGFDSVDCLVANFDPGVDAITAD